MVRLVPCNIPPSGAEGEFVIYQKADEPETGSEAGKGSDETADDAHNKKMCSEE
jgi:hypothetical protein